jgi:serine-type D-Ala-D-Ala carboxypeptidase/endopeptidase (penicillin-binding protein 4)
MWPENQQHRRYAAQVGGLNLNVNCLDFTVEASRMGATVNYSTTPATGYASVRNTCVMGSNDAIWLSRNPGGNDIILRGETPNRTSVVSVTIHDPPMYAGTVLAETLQRSGIAITGQVMRDEADRPRAEGQILAVHETPLAPVLARLNKDSQNLYGEALLKRLGHAWTGQPGSWDNGAAAVGAFLRRIGVPASQFHISDGSGLSRGNSISPDGMTRVLVHSFHQPSRQMYIDSLAIGGGDGTLANRFRGGPAGRVFAKSGYISGVSGLSGYLQKEDGTWYAFAILFNNIPPGSNSMMRSLQDRLVAAIDRN